MRVYLCQNEPVWEDRAASCDHVRAALKDVHGPGLLILPEMFATGFSMNAAATAEPADGPTLAFLRDVAARHDLHVLGGLVTRHADGCRNEAVGVAPDGDLLCRYAKIKLFTPSGEADAHVPGRRTVVCSCLRAGLAPFVCYDLRFPELFRAAVSMAAEVLVVIASWPAARHQHWQTLLRARAIENQAYVLGVNRCGRDPNATYAGGSVVVDPRGQEVARAGDRPTVLAATLDLDALRTCRRDFPALRDM